jgi:hypothetical protein
MIHPSGVAQPDSKLNEEIARLYQSHHGGTDDMVSLRLNSEIGSAAAALRQAKRAGKRDIEYQPPPPPSKKENAFDDIMHSRISAGRRDGEYGERGHDTVSIAALQARVERAARVQALLLENDTAPRAQESSDDNRREMRDARSKALVLAAAESPSVLAIKGSVRVQIPPNTRAGDLMKVQVPVMGSSPAQALAGLSLFHQVA